MLGKKQYIPPRVVMVRPKPVALMLLAPLLPAAAKVNELSDVSLIPKKTSSPLMLNTALPSGVPPGAVADFTKSDFWFH